jgi:hypothetical protein
MITYLHYMKGIDMYIELKSWHMYFGAIVSLIISIVWVVGMPNYEHIPAETNLLFHLPALLFFVFAVLLGIAGFIKSRQENS